MSDTTPVDLDVSAIAAAIHACDCGCDDFRHDALDEWYMKLAEAALRVVTPQLDRLNADIADKLLEIEAIEQTHTECHGYEVAAVERAEAAQVEIENLRRQLSTARNVSGALATAVWPDDRLKAAHDAAMQLLDQVYYMRAHGESTDDAMTWAAFDLRLVAFLQATDGGEVVSDE